MIYIYVAILFLAGFLLDAILESDTLRTIALILFIILSCFAIGYLVSRAGVII